MLVSDDRDVRVWLADLTHTAGGRPTNDTVPLGAAFVTSYVSVRFPDGARPRLFKYPERLTAALEAEGPPDVIAFSSYLWNTRLSRCFARTIKKLSPSTVVVFGGPNLPLGLAEKRAYLVATPEIDFFIEREGEIAFATLIEILGASGWDIAAARGRASSTHAIEDGRLRSAALADRLLNLDEIPSPYLTGLLDEFLDGFLVPTVQTNRGCPFTCSFCVEGDKYFSKVAAFSPERVEAELRYIAELIQPTLRAGGRNELMITDSNFAMFTADKRTCAVVGELSETYDWPHRVNVTTGKNRRNRVLSSIRLANGRIQLTGAVQSLEESVLQHVQRSNISTDDLLAVAMDAADSGTNTYSDVILGLPGDSVDAHMNSVLTLVDGGFGRINTYQFALLPGAAINTPQSRATFRLRTKFRVVPRGFGRYKIGDEEVACAEIDEVCIGSDTLSFEGYLRCRLFDVVVFWFHNDGVFLATEAAVKRLGGTLSSWLRHIERRDTWPPTLDSIRQAFVEESRAQLFDSADEVIADVTHHTSSYLDDERGNNLLYSYRARGLRDGLTELGQVALEAATAVTGAAGPDLALLHNAVRFDEMALADVLVGDATREVTAHFMCDVIALLQDPAVRDDALRPSGGVTIGFESSATGAEFLTYHRTMGSGAEAIGRALSRVMVRDLRRVPGYCDPQSARSA
ncbi:MAG TPA: radical SAM protein [Acidimicrobiales bacterium]|nr:radical SAM protein [Acidimicrobiales bacterium]